VNFDQNTAILLFLTNVYFLQRNPKFTRDVAKNNIVENEGKYFND